MVKKINRFALIIGVFLGIMLVTNLANTNVSFAKDNTNDEYDKCFISVFEQTVIEEYGSYKSFIYNKEMIYDIDLEFLGFIYNFTINNEVGYAIVINANDTLEVVELFFNTENPYHNLSNEKKIYTNYFKYLYLDNNQFYEVENGVLLSTNELNKIRETAFYSGNTDFIYSTEKINYTNKYENEKHLAKRHPYLADINELANECGAIAGANIIQYWDRYNNELIANFESGKLLGSAYIYNGQNQNLNDLILQMYADMETNKLTPGTSISNFKNGLEKYTKRNGNYNITFNSCMNEGVISFSKTKENLDKGYPIALFLDGYNVVDILQEEQCDTYEYLTSKVSHVVVGFGYKEITYTLHNNQTKKEFLVEIATGIKSKAKGYINMSYNANIDDAFGILIN